MNDDITGAVAGELAEWSTLEEAHPLALERLWHREGVVQHSEPCERGSKACMVCAGVDDVGRSRTSQRAIAALLLQVRTLYVGGGNRSSKTAGMLRCMVALALGSDHPMARAFWLAAGVDPDTEDEDGRVILPRGPANSDHNDGEVWIIALGSSLSIEYHRELVALLVGPYLVRFANRQGRGTAVMDLYCPGYAYPAVVRFKSDDMQRRGMQGQACRAVLHDEEGREGVWDECLTRCTDANGWHVMSNTPIEGITWVDGRLVKKTAPNAEHDCIVAYLHTPDNPYLSIAGVKRLAAGDGRLRETKLFGIATQLTGAVYPAWNEAIHVVPPFVIPPEWDRFRAIDFGTSSTFACVHCARSPDGQLIAYREHCRTPGGLLSRNVDAIRLSEGWIAKEGGGWRPPTADEPPAERVVMGWCDQEDPQQHQQLVLEHDLTVSKARKAVKVGIDRVSQALEVRECGTPGLVVFSTCINVRREFPGYVYPPDTDRSDGRNLPMKKNDHTLDCIRYTVMGVLGWYGIG